MLVISDTCTSCDILKLHLVELQGKAALLSTNKMSQEEGWINESTKPADNLADRISGLSTEQQKTDKPDKPEQEELEVSVSRTA